MAKKVTFEGSQTWKSGSRRRKNYKGKSLNPKQRNQVKSMMEKTLNGVLETKFFDIDRDPSDYTLSLLASSANAQTFLLTPVPQDITSETRIGDHIKPKYFNLRVAVTGGIRGTSQLAEFRCILFQFKPGNDSIAANSIGLSRILDDNQDAWSSYARGNMEDYRILYDGKIPTVASAGNPDNVHMIDVTIPGKKLLPLEFDGAATTGSNQIYLTMGYNFDAGAFTEAPMTVHRSRLAYTDA